MPVIFISDSGDDKNDGLTESMPIYSWHQYLRLKSADDQIVIMGNKETTIARLKAEIDAKGQKA
jgi:hypothetical protein